LRLLVEQLEDRLASATYRWERGAGTPNWTNANNWLIFNNLLNRYIQCLPGDYPGAGDLVRFEGTSTGACVVNEVTTIASLFVESNCTASIELPVFVGNSALTVTTGLSMYGASIRGFTPVGNPIQRGVLSLGPDSSSFWVGGTFKDMTVDVRRNCTFRDFLTLRLRG
jgi:hypothetical protein